MLSKRSQSLASRLLSDASQRRRAAVFSIGCALAGVGTSGLALGGAEALRSVYSGGNSPWMMDGRSTVSLWQPQGLMACAIMAVSGALVKWLGTTLAAYSGARMSGELGRSLRRDLLTHWFADLGHGDQRARSSDALSMLTLRAAEAEQALAQGAFRMLRGALSFLPLVALLLATTPRFAWVALGAMGLFSWVLGRARRAFRARYARLQERVDTYVGAADEATRYADLWVTFGATGWVLRSLDALTAELSRIRARGEALGAWLSGSNEVLAALAVLLGAAILKWQGAERQEMELVRASVLVFVGYGPLREWTEGRLAYARGSAALGEWLRAKPDAPREEAPKRTWPEGELVLEKFCPARATAAVSVRIPFGSIVAIVGPTGSGKTSLLRTLLGLDAARTGTVHYAHINITQAKTGPGERPFAWAPQEAPLVSGTLDENIWLGAKARDDTDRVLEPIRARVPEDGGRLGAGGIALSGGEKAWVSLARALASGLPVLLLDEPTAALDSASQERYLETLAALKGTRTIVLVTHRQEPLALADQIVKIAR